MLKVNLLQARYWITLLLAIFNPLVANADSINPAMVTDFTSGKIVQTFLSLLAVIVLIMLLAFVLRRAMFWRHNATGTLKVSGIIPLSTKERIVLVTLENKTLLLGVTPSSINTLYIYDTSDKNISPRVRKVQ